MKEIRWTHKDGRDGEWCKHYRGIYVVTCQDMDGDGTEWGVGLREDYDRPLPKDPLQLHKDWRIAYGFVGPYCINDFEVAKVVAIHALAAIIKDREDYQAEERGAASASPSQEG